MELHHKKLLEEIRIDENGISVSSPFQKFFHWEKVVLVIGYKKESILGFTHCIGLMVQDQNSSMVHFSPFTTRDVWKYRYFLESIVKYLIDKYDAKGSKAWCARPLDKEGRLVEDNGLYRSYVLCRIFADKLGTRWFDHTQDDEEIIALEFLTKHLLRDGTEYRQISEAIDKTRFPVQENGSINMFVSAGYKILDDARMIKFSRKPQ